MPSLPRRIASEFNDRLRSPETAALVAGIEGKLTKRRRDQKMESGAFRGMEVVVYRGFVAGRRCREGQGQGPRGARTARRQPDSLLGHRAINLPSARRSPSSGSRWN